RQSAQAGRGGNAARHRSGAASFPYLEREDRQGTRDRAAKVVRPDDGQSGRPRTADDHRTGQAACGIARRSRVCGVISGMVRRRSQARVRRYDSPAPAGQAHRRNHAAHRRGRVHHPVEFSAGDDHAQGRPGHRRGLHGRSQAGIANAVFRAGVPKGVLNIVTGSAAAIGGELTSNPIVKKLSFTGSTEIGKILMAQCAGTVKKLSLELGGNAPFIVFDDADLDAAVEGAIASKYRNTGQTCVCTNRVLVQDSVYDAFAAKLAAAVAKLKPAPGLEPGAN